MLGINIDSFFLQYSRYDILPVCRLYDYWYFECVQLLHPAVIKQIRYLAPGHTVHVKPGLAWVLGSIRVLGIISDNPIRSWKKVSLQHHLYQESHATTSHLPIHLRTNWDLACVVVEFSVHNHDQVTDHNTESIL